MTNRSLFQVLVLLVCLSGCTKDNPIEPEKADTQAPTVSILFPVTGSSLKVDTTYTIIVDAKDNKAVSSVDFYIDSSKAGTDNSSPYQYSWNTAGKVGDHSVMAKASDSAGNIGVSTVVTVKVLDINHPPATPNNPIPSDTSTNISTSSLLIWSCSDPDSNALTYDVYFGTSSNPTIVVATNQSLASLSRNGLANNTTYYWKIIAKDSKGAITAGPVWSFTTAAAVIIHPPNAPNNIFPANGATGIPTSPILMWSCSDPDSNALTYDIYFGTSSNPTTIVATNQSTASFGMSGLALRTMYYWRVVAKNSKGALTMGAVWNFTTFANNPPASSSNPNPTDGAIGVSTSPSLSWSCSDPDGDPLTYEVYLGTTSYPTTVVATNQSTPSFGLSGLAYSTTYYWEIIAKDGKGALSVIPIWSFTTAAAVNHPPNAPNNPSPANGAIGIPASTALGWSCSDPDGDALTYDIFFGTSNPPTTQVATGQRSATLSRAGLSSSTTYYWEIVAKDSKGTTTAGPVWSFATGSGLIFQSMVQVTGGTFQMGSNDQIDNAARPAHTVTVGSFHIDMYETTYEMWTDVRTWALTHGYTDLTAGKNGYSPSGANNPVTEVTWYDVLKWCNARSEMNGLTPVYYTDNTLTTVYRTVMGKNDIAVDAVNWTANGCRLPTEAEWEFAARGGNNSHGYTYSGSNTIGDVAWWYSNSDSTTHSVSTKSVNELGIYDMSGNGYEWCWDWYGVYSSGAQIDPKGAAPGAPSESYHVLRGGSFRAGGGVVGGAAVCRVAYRTLDFPSSKGLYYLTPTLLRSHGYGFRCAQN